MMMKRMEGEWKGGEGKKNAQGAWTGVVGMESRAATVASSAASMDMEEGWGGTAADADDAVDSIDGWMDGWVGGGRGREG